MTYTCSDEKRRAAVVADGKLNGIDWLEVVDSDAPTQELRQRVLAVRLLKPVPAGFSRSNVRIEGGERIPNIQVSEVATGTDPVVWKPVSSLDQPDHVLLVLSDRRGDFSKYRLTLVRGDDDGRPPEKFDPCLVEVSFWFKVECPSDFDCKQVTMRAEAQESLPDIDYLVKDYTGFRQLMLDRLSRLVPGWRERTPADLGVVLTELLAATADELSYWQDAVSTEAYLETARRRTSLRRHALLVDYQVSDGCNARVWVQVRVNADGVALKRLDLHFLTKVSGVPDRITPGSADETKALQGSPLVFEPMHDSVLYKDHDEMNFYTWSDSECCLPEDATSATLRGHFPHLATGDVLVLAEAKGPLHGKAAEANPQRRHAVRLIDVKAYDDDDPTQPRVDPLTSQQITEITWGDADKLPFQLYLTTESATDVSVALGNIVLADHGQTVDDEDLGAVPEARPRYPAERDSSRDSQPADALVPVRFRPRLAEKPLTWSGQVSKTVWQGGITSSELAPFDPDAAASEAMTWKMENTAPCIALSANGGLKWPWEPRPDLLNSEKAHRHFVAETECDGTCRLRFGDDTNGKRPMAGEAFTARYRVGNGIEGNVGTGAIAHVVTTDGRIDSVSNPLPAQGGTDPETLEQIRRRAPQAFRTQERAVTPEDYAEMTERLSGVQRAAAGLRWTGSWHTVFVTVDREGGKQVDDTYADTVCRHLDRYRMAGHDLKVAGPKLVPLEIDMLICVDEDYFRGDVRQGLLQALGNRTLPDGRRGVFHPDNFTFGQTVYLSPIYAAARGVPGVASAQVTLFQRLGQDDPKPLADEFLALGPLEIACLDNDPNYPERGVLRLDLRGGK